MRRFITIILLFVSAFSIASAITYYSEDETKSKIDIYLDQNFGALKEHRSLSNYIIEGYVLSISNQVEVFASNIGEAEVYIVNSLNQIVDYTIVNTDTPSRAYLSTNGAGNYQLIIISETCYAVGQFTL